LQAREAYRERCEGLVAELDLVLAPTLAFVAPRLPVADLEIRESTVLLTFPLNALGWPALALPCGPAEDGLPASAQLIGRPGQDALVLAAGAALESLLQASERSAPPVDL
jgi:aspartyl-tRNA(Asn)/glutamyl-tRNA(Gln) amidotransferase subunit A